MTSGISFPFSRDEKDYLLKKSRTLARIIPADNDATKRSAAFFRLYRKKGIEVFFE